MKAYFSVVFLMLLGLHINCFPNQNWLESSIIPTHNSDQAKINTQLLCQHWIHSQEERGANEKDEIYRPAGFKEFPASRFRMEYIFAPKGDCQWYYLSPDDGHHFKSGKWKVDPQNKSILQINKDDVIELYQVTELTKDKLKMTRLKSHS